MTSTNSDIQNPAHLRQSLQNFLEQANKVIIDKDREIRLTTCCLLAGGHLLIEDIPGVGKTTLVKMLAQSLGLSFSRIQFTNDLLPADILGGAVFIKERGQFEFHRGPIFAELVLGDELNRATPKTQSACLQAMEEHKITVDGETHLLPRPFFFIATQNPRQQIGTFPLPESQLDRFLMRIQLGYPSRTGEKTLLMSQSRETLIESLPKILSTEHLLQMQEQVRKVHVSEAIVEYVQNLVDRSRTESERIRSVGLSPRAALGLIRASQSWAYLSGRQNVIPEDVQAVAVAVMSHRLNPSDDFSGESGKRLSEDIVLQVRVD